MIPVSSLWNVTGPWLEAMISCLFWSISSQELQISSLTDGLILLSEVCTEFNLGRVTIIINLHPILALDNERKGIKLNHLILPWAQNFVIKRLFKYLTMRYSYIADCAWVS
jgi:hypothetical protein